MASYKIFSSYNLMATEYPNILLYYLYMALLRIKKLYVWCKLFTYVIWDTNEIYNTDTPVQLSLNLTYALHIC
jgi:hypothetical protein